MNGSLKAYEVLTAIFQAFEEKTGHQTAIQLRDRSTLYECVHELCRRYPDQMFPFEFSRRSGRLTSTDVDICLRNLEDSARLRCRNPDLVDFEATDQMRKQYSRQVKPKLEEYGLLEQFGEISTQHLTSAT